MIVGAFIGAGLILIVRWFSTRGVFSLSMTILFFGCAGVLLVAKASETIERVEFRGYDPVGKTGVVTTSGEGTVCSVRVNGLEWPATSNGVLVVGDQILVLSREGLRLRVQKSHPTRTWPEESKSSEKQEGA